VNRSIALLALCQSLLLTGTQRALAVSESEDRMEAQVFTFASSPFVPVAIGFFGLGTGYFIWGGQALFGFPTSSPDAVSYTHLTLPTICSV